MEKTRPFRMTWKRWTDGKGKGCGVGSRTKEIFHVGREIEASRRRGPSDPREGRSRPRPARSSSRVLRCSNGLEIRSCRRGKGSFEAMPAIAPSVLSMVPTGKGSSTSNRRGPDYRRVSRNLAMDLVRVTEAGALAGARWLGKGDKEGADQAAVDAMRHVLAFVPMQGRVVIGEGEKDEAPMLYNGEEVGDGTGEAMDVAVDPLDGTRLTAYGRDGALSVIAVAPRGTMFDPGPVMYMDKLAVQKRAARFVDLSHSVEDNIRGVAEALGKEIDDVTVIMLDRPRHTHLLQRCRDAGARIKLITDGDVEASIAAASPNTNVDMMLGIGGTPEGVISAAALRCMGAKFQGRLAPRNDEERSKAVAMGYHLDKVLSMEELCRSDDVFFAATGVSNGDLLKGIEFNADGAVSYSIVMRSASGTIRFLETHHRWEKQTLQDIGVVHTNSSHLQSA